MITDTVIRNIKCDAPGCEHVVIYDQKEFKPVVDANPWLQTVREIQTADGRNFSYCSDLCEVAGVGTEEHNPPKPKAVEVPNGNATEAIRVAAQAAAARDKATADIKAGRPAIVPAR